MVASGSGLGAEEGGAGGLVAWERGVEVEEAMAGGDTDAELRCSSRGGRGGGGGGDGARAWGSRELGWGG